MPFSVGYIVGSTSSTSINRKIVDALIEIEGGRAEADRADQADQADQMVFTEIPIGNLPLYSSDVDGDFPPEALELKDMIRSSDALLIATPEYNRSIPGALKNAIDWASRPYGESVFPGKPVGVIGASVGAPGTSMAQQHLRNILAYLDAPTLGQPEVFLQFDPGWFDDDGTMVEPSTRGFLTDWLSAYRNWISRFVDARST